MVSIPSLWLPILLSSVAVFLASWLVHTVLPWHKGDYDTIPNEAKVMDALRPLNIPPGDYMVPRPQSMQEMRTPEFQEKTKKGPVFVVTFMPNAMMNMGKSLGQWFVYIVVVSIIAAYIAGRALGPGAEYLKVFRFVGAAAFTAYAVALWQMSIWYQRKVRTTLMANFDGLIYALLSAGFFGWLWPR